MKILAVDTATAWQSVAIVENDAVLARADQDAGGAHGTVLLPAIDRLFAQTGLKLTDLNGLACSIGPGSFTGIRVGVATCLGLRMATGLPLALVPTLEAMAWSVASSTLPLCPVLPSRKGELYWAVLRRTPDHQLERMVIEHAGTPGLLAESLPEEVFIFGEGWTMMEAEIRAAIPASVTLSSVGVPFFKPSAAAVAFLGMERLRRGDIAGDHVMPLYVQRAEAEIKFEQSGGVSPVARRQERIAAKAKQRLARSRYGRGTGIRQGKSHDV